MFIIELEPCIQQIRQNFLIFNSILAIENLIKNQNLILANLNFNNIHFWLYIASQKTKCLHMTLECRDTKLWPIFGWHPHVSTLKGREWQSPQKKEKRKRQLD
jgi:hypothetical protein